ncbi:urease accessory protein UreE [Photobacterium aquimaris]|uniref:Urease accessory protein UreE n=1 Tax=Photobacterium aquimaris TaxID=512643 RepID=A0A1Y6L0N9_9GAMM|nr:urease accessory protein UreE [Photobacterium aquimaris]SMY16887.1 Urease accessory protein UreE [Photobacterium aquimaris]
MIELVAIKVNNISVPHGYLSLPIDSRIKSRLKVTLDDGRSGGVFLPRGHILRDGEQLLSRCGLTIEIKAAPESVSTVYSEDPLLLSRIAYHLGNRHVPLQITEQWLRYQHDHVLDQMVLGLGGEIKIGIEPFEPEGGAYGASITEHHDH